MSSLSFLQVGGRRLEAAWHGPGPEAAPTLVFLHEGLGCVGTWKRFPARLAAATGCGALVYSRAGYGRSDPAPLPRSPRFLHEEALSVLPGVLAAARIREAILVGHSDGGSIALIYSGRTGRAGRAGSGNGAGGETRIRGLILEAPHVVCEDRTRQAIAETVEAFGRGELRRKLARRHGPNLEGAFWGWTGIWLDPAFRQWDITGDLPGVRVPVLALQGRDDEYGTAIHLEAIAAGCSGPVRRLELEGCGHAPHRDQPERVLETATSFVAGVLGIDPR